MSATRPVFEDLAVGDVVGTRTLELDRPRLVRYAGASGDFNRIHWDEAFATGVGLPSVIVHGMLTMGAAVGVVEDWAGDPGAVVGLLAGDEPEVQTMPVRLIPGTTTGPAPQL